MRSTQFAAAVYNGYSSSPLERKRHAVWGGVLIIGSFDHKQLGSVDGLSFLLNHHIISDFTVVRLEQSVRAAEDEKLQVSLSPVVVGMFS